MCDVVSNRESDVESLFYIYAGDKKHKVKKKPDQYRPFTRLRRRMSVKNRGKVDADLSGEGEERLDGPEKSVASSSVPSKKFAGLFKEDELMQCRLRPLDPEKLKIVEDTHARVSEAEHSKWADLKTRSSVEDSKLVSVGTIELSLFNFSRLHGTRWIGDEVKQCTAIHVQ